MMFAVPVKGVGLPDYTATMERITSPTMSPILRQRAAMGPFAGWIPTRPFPLMYNMVLEQPQEDGTFGWIASSISVHWSRVEIAASSNCLLRIEFLRYRSFLDAAMGIPDVVYPGVYGYGKAIVEYSAGIKTEPGYLYGERMGIWSPNAWEYITISAIGLITDLTPPWMVWGHITF